MRLLIVFLLINVNVAVAQRGRNISVNDVRKSIRKKSNDKEEKKTEEEVEKTEVSRETTRGNSNDEDKEAINSKYEELKYDLRGVKKYLNPSSSDGFSDFLKTMEILNKKDINLAKIESMLNEPGEQEKADEIGYISSRSAITDDMLPGIKSALDGTNTNDYSLDRLNSKLDQIAGDIVVAVADGPESDSKAKGIEDFYKGVLLFQTFTNNHSSLEPIVKKAAYYNSSVQNQRGEKFAKYRSGDFHRSEGSGIYVVQQDGVTPETLSKEMVTEKVIIDGTKPVHIFILTDLSLEQSMYGAGLQFDFVDGGKNQNQNKYVFDSHRMISVEDHEKELGFKKMVFVPSDAWNDVSENYSKSMFYDCGTQKKLASVLVPGVSQDFTIYSVNGKLKKTISIEATEEGIAFLKGMETKMARIAIDNARMEKKEISDPTMETKISKGFVANSNGQVTEVKRVVITSKPWFIKKNAYGVTLYRDFYAQVAFTKKDGKHYFQKVRCKSESVNGSFQAMKVYGSGPSKEIRAENIMK